MTILLATHELFFRHETGPHHPERAERLAAVRVGVETSGVLDAVIAFEPTPAPLETIRAVHPGRYLLGLEELSIGGGGHIDADTMAGPDSYQAALLAAGAGLDSVRRLGAGEADVAFCAVRPPGHHATPTQPMGFCLINNVAVAASYLADQGERVLIVDYDAHHGNGTQDIFYTDPRVTYVSIHQFPLYPGTGALNESGEGAGAGSTINIPLPAGATGDVFRAAVDEVIAPYVDAWEPTWLLVSAGFDAHRRDPITHLELAAGDFADLARVLVPMVPTGRCVLFLEGGYDLEGLAHSVAATFATLAGEDHRPEPATSGGPGRHVVDAVRRFRDGHGFA